MLDKTNPGSRREIGHLGDGIVGGRRLLLGEEASDASSSWRPRPRRPGRRPGSWREGRSARPGTPAGLPAMARAATRVEKPNGAWTSRSSGAPAGGGGKPLPGLRSVLHEPSFSLSSAKSFCNFLRARKARTLTTDWFQPVRELISAMRLLLEVKHAYDHLVGGLELVQKPVHQFAGGQGIVRGHRGFVRRGRVQHPASFSDRSAQRYSGPPLLGPQLVDAGRHALSATPSAETARLP